jgi:hypothetical protein
MSGVTAEGGCMTPVLTFIIPVRHPDNAKDWSKIRCHLGETARSIAAQDNPGWRAIIVANHGADLPDLPPGFCVTRVDFPPNPLPHAPERARRQPSNRTTHLDKGRRLLAGMSHALEVSGGAPGHFMIVDDDDFVHRGLTSFAAANPQANGWYFREGYIWTDSGTILYRHDGFEQECGTSHIIRHDLFCPPGRPAIIDEAQTRVLGDHNGWRDYFAARGTPLAPLPFCGAVYRVGHSESWSHSRGIWRRHFLTKAMLKNPAELARRALRLRLKGREIEAVYFGG